MSSVTETYQSLTPESRRLFSRTRARIPGGATRSLNSWSPYPIYLVKGRGATVVDVDGRVLVDLLNNYTALILGHAAPEVLDAVRSRLDAGSSHSFSTGLEAELAELLCDRVPSMDKVRFTGSGTEAVMFALRIARAATGRSHAAKAEGGYHGTLDEMMVSVRPHVGDAGPPEEPRAVPDMEGLASGVDRTVVLPYNDVENTLRILRRERDRLAAVIVEPMLGVGGMVPATPDYLRALRECCTELGIVLVFDEVITLRMAPGGGQEYFGVVPDLTVTGKIVGGGLPIGSYGGRVELMDLLEPRGGNDVYDARSGGPRLYQGGTFTGNPYSLAAGLATMHRLDAATLHALNTCGDQMRETLNAEARREGLPLCVTGAGSLFNLHMVETPVETFRDTRRADAIRQHNLFLALLNRGFVVAPRGMACLSLAHTPEHRAAFTEAVLEAASLAVRDGGGQR